LGYIDFLSLLSNCAAVFTDSGGIQEEATALGISCLTLRENTERPITVTQGTNRVIGVSPERIVRETRRVLEADAGPADLPRPPLWDGRAAERTVQAILTWADAGAVDTVNVAV